MTIDVQIGFIAPTFTADVIANLLLGIPVILVPLVLLGMPLERTGRESTSGGSTHWPTRATSAVTRGYDAPGRQHGPADRYGILMADTYISTIGR